MCPYRYYDIMRESKDPRQLRYRMVISVEKDGIRETSSIFHVSRTTVRKWHRRWQEEGYRGLEERSRRPHHSPNATPQKLRKRLVKLKHKYRRVGAEQIRAIEGLTISSRTMRKIWREESVSSRKRR